MCESSTLFDVAQQIIQHILNPKLGLVVPIPDDADAASCQFARSRFVVSGVLRRAVLSAIKLNCERKLGTIEIKDIGADNVLSLEFISVKAAVAQMVPEHALGMGHVASQLARVAFHAWVEAVHG